MTDSSLRIVFAGTPDFAAAHLQALLDSPHQVIAVLTQPDRKAGRGKSLRPSPVKQLALDHELPVYQPLSLKDAGTETLLRELTPDLMVVVAYGLLLPQAILDIPRLGCINVHASLLPRWRGAAPIERAILAGDKQSGISIMQMDAGLDTGDILATGATDITPEDNSAMLTERLIHIGQELLLETLDRLGNQSRGELQSTPQDESLCTYADKLSKEDASIDWQSGADQILRQMRAFFPRSPAFSFMGKERVRLLDGYKVSNHSLKNQGSASPGEILQADKSGLLVACSQGALQLTRVQLAGKKPVSVAELLNARREQFAPGKTFTTDGQHV